MARLDEFFWVHTQDSGNFKENFQSWLVPILDIAIDHVIAFAELLGKPSLGNSLFLKHFFDPVHS